MGEGIIDFLVLADNSVQTFPYKLAKMLGVIEIDKAESIVDKMNEKTKSFVSKNYVSDFFDKRIYGINQDDQTENGNWLSHNAYGFDMTRNIGSGIGYIGGIIGLSLLTCGVGGAAVGAGASTGTIASVSIGGATATLSTQAVVSGVIATAAGTGKNAAEAYSNDTDYYSGLQYGLTKGTWEGFEMILGNVINTIKIVPVDKVGAQIVNSFSHAVLDGVDAASGEILSPAFSLISNVDENMKKQIITSLNSTKTWEQLTLLEKYKGIFKINGGWQKVASSAAAGSIISMLSEIGDIITVSKSLRNLDDNNILIKDLSEPEPPQLTSKNNNDEIIQLAERVTKTFDEQITESKKIISREKFTFKVKSLDEIDFNKLKEIENKEHLLFSIDSSSPLTYSKIIDIKKNNILDRLTPENLINYQKNNSETFISTEGITLSKVDINNQITKVLETGQKDQVEKLLKGIGLSNILNLQLSQNATKNISSVIGIEPKYLKDLIDPSLPLKDQINIMLKGKEEHIILLDDNLTINDLLNIKNNSQSSNNYFLNGSQKITVDELINTKTNNLLNLFDQINNDKTTYTDLLETKGINFNDAIIDLHNLQKATTNPKISQTIVKITENCNYDEIKYVTTEFNKTEILKLPLTKKALNNLSYYIPYDFSKAYRYLADQKLSIQDQIKYANNSANDTFILLNSTEDITFEELMSLKNINNQQTWSYAPKTYFLIDNEEIIAKDLLTKKVFDFSKGKTSFAKQLDILKELNENTIFIRNLKAYVDTSNTKEEEIAQMLADYLINVKYKFDTFNLVIDNQITTPYQYLSNYIKRNYHKDIDPEMILLYVKNYNENVGLLSFNNNNGFLDSLANFDNSYFEARDKLFDLFVKMNLGGVDQGGIYKLCNYDYNGKIYSYDEAQKIMDSYIKNPQGVKLLFRQVINEEYEYFKDKLVKSGFTELDADTILLSIDSTGACSYADACNQIIYQFSNNPELFKKTFGYELYKDINGTKKLNTLELLIDLYVFANKEENGGKLIIGNKVNRNLILKDVITPTGNTLMATKNQVFLSSYNDGANVDIVNAFLASKNANLEEVQEFFIRDNPKIDFEELYKNCKIKLANGECLAMEIYNDDKNNNIIRMQSLSREGYEVTTNSKGFGHAITIMGINNDKKPGFYVNSWGDVFFIPYEDLKNGGVFCLYSTKIKEKQ